MYIIVGVRAGTESRLCRPLVPLSFVVGTGVPGSCS